MLHHISWSGSGLIQVPSHFKGEVRGKHLPRCTAARPRAHSLLPCGQRSRCSEELDARARSPLLPPARVTHFKSHLSPSHFKQRRTKQVSLCTDGDTDAGVQGADGLATVLLEYGQCPPPQPVCALRVGRSCCSEDQTTVCPTQ